MNVEQPRTPVLDLGRPEGVAVEVDASEAADVLMSLFAVFGRDDLDSLEVGRERLEGIRAGVAPDLIERIEALMQGNEKVPAHLLGLVWSTPRPRTLPAFVEHLRRTDALEVHLHLLAYYAGHHHGIPLETAYAAATGDEAAIEEALAALAEWPQAVRTTEHLLRLGAEGAKSALLEILPRWYEEVYLPAAGDSAETLERDAEAKRELARTHTPERFAELATNGYRYSPTPDVRRLVFFPGTWQRPWLLLYDYKHVKLFCYPAAPERGPDGPSAAELARLYKALADEGRLKLLKRTSAGPLTLGEAAQELGVAKSTAHHHLALLRHAGLVVVENAGDDTVYSLRRDLLPQAGALLETYLR